MSTKTNETKDIEQGPYRAVERSSQAGWFVIQGPTEVLGESGRSTAQAHVDDLNAAYSAGRNSVSKDYTERVMEVVSRRVNGYCGRHVRDKTLPFDRTALMAAIREELEGMFNTEPKTERS